MKYCEDFAALLDLYADGELSPEEMARVQAHLDTCPGCRAYVDDALAIRAAFPDAEETEVPDGFCDGVMAVIRAEAAPQRKRKAPWFKVVLPLAACLAIVVLVQNRPMESFSATADTAAPASLELAETEEAAEEPAVAADAASGALEARDSAPPEASEEPSEKKQTGSTSSETQDAPVAYTTSTSEAPSAPASFAAQAPAAESISYLAVLTVAEDDVGSLLDGFTPTEETAETVRYELNTADYEALLTALSEEGAAWEETVGTADAETALVIVTRS